MRESDFVIQYVPRQATGSAGNPFDNDWFSFALSVSSASEPEIQLAVFRVLVQQPRRAIGQLKHMAATARDRFEGAARRWCLSRVETRLRSGDLESLDPRNPEILEINPDDMVVITRLAAKKTCSYQVTEGRDLFCSAASPEDPKKVETSGAHTLAPTSPPLCRDCDLPDTDWLCSHFLHPQVEFSDVGGSRRRRVRGSDCLCARDQDERIRKRPSLCFPGGHDCWERLVAQEPPSPTQPRSVDELYTAFDFFDTVWRQRFGKRILQLKSAADVGNLAFPCTTRAEFKERMSSLAVLFKRMVAPEDLLPNDNKGRIPKDHTLQRIKAVLVSCLPEGAAEPVAEAIKRLQVINEVRVGLQHSRSRVTLPAALNELGISYPITDYTEAWQRIRSAATDALTDLRKAVQNLTED